MLLEKDPDAKEAKFKAIPDIVGEHHFSFGFVINLMLLYSGMDLGL